MPATNAFRTPTAATTLQPTVAPRLGDRTVGPQHEPARRCRSVRLLDQSGSTPDPSGPLLKASFAVASVASLRFVIGLRCSCCRRRLDPQKRLAALVRPSTKRRVAATRSPTLAKLPRRIARRVMMETNTSTRFIQLAEVGVKCRGTRGMLGEPGLGREMGVGAVVVEHHMQLPPRVGLGHQLEEHEELGVAVSVVPPAGRIGRRGRRPGAPLAGQRADHADGLRGCLPTGSPSVRWHAPSGGVRPGLVGVARGPDRRRRRPGTGQRNGRTSGRG